MQKVQLKIINRAPNTLPAYETTGAAGMDVRAFLAGPETLQPMERKLIPTGLFVEIPEGFEMQVRPRSGLAFKNGITCLNSPGTIDSDYRGEIKVLLINLSAEIQVINNNDRIAQLVLSKVETAELLEATLLNESQRGAGGFGHTGK